MTTKNMFVSRSSQLTEEYFNVTEGNLLTKSKNLAGIQCRFMTYRFYATDKSFPLSDHDIVVHIQ